MSTPRCSFCGFLGHDAAACPWDMKRVRDEKPKPKAAAEMPKQAPTERAIARREAFDRAGRLDLIKARHLARHR